MRRAVVAMFCLALLVAPSAGAAQQPDHVVIFALPGFDWDVFARAQHPVLQQLIDTGAVGAMSIRSASKGSTPIRGYLTMGAGNRAFAPTEVKPRRDESQGQVALHASDRFENGTAVQAMARRVVRPRAGAIVVPDMPALDALQHGVGYGTLVGELGELLARRGVTRAVVSAADLRTSPSTESMRRSVALSVTDESGTVDGGEVAGLLRPAPDAAYGVETEPGAFADAVQEALGSARFVVVDAGETLRADEFALASRTREADAQRVGALQRTDALIGRVAALLTPRDVLYVVGVSSPLNDPRDHLTLAVAHGSGISRGWLTSPTTHRQGVVTLTDVAPTVLDDFGGTIPASMSGTPIRSVHSSATDRIGPLVSLDRQSSFGDRFQGIAAKLLIGLLAAIAIALALRRSVAWPSFAALAVPPAAYLVRVVPVYRMGILGATVVLCAVVAAVATAVSLLPFSAWKSALVLVGASFLVTTGDLFAGAPLQVNNVFGYSPISAGRFYGNSNIEFAVLIATALIVVFGLLQVPGASRIGAWAVAVLIGVVVVQGLPQFGADFGGVAASVPAMLIAYALARGRGVHIWRIAAWAAAGGAAGVAVTLFDLSRPPQARTHLGRFATRLFSGGAADIVRRKLQSNIGLLGSAWTWTVAIAVVVLLLVLRNNPHALRDMHRRRPMLTAAVAATVAAGVIGFAVNDTGIWVLGMTLAYAVPMGVLVAADDTQIGSVHGRTLVQRPAEEAGRRGQGGP